VRERECVGHSRCSWDETVRLTGRGKKVAGTGVVEGEVGSEVTVVEVDVKVPMAVAGDCGLEEEGEEEGDVGFCRRNTSPAPSQSELVIIGVWIWTNSFSCTSVSLRQARRCWTHLLNCRLLLGFEVVRINRSRNPPRTNHASRA